MFSENIKIRQQIRFFPFYLFFVILVIGTVNYPFFWDTIQLASKQAHFFYESDFHTIILPNEIDSGHIPSLGIYLALIWKITNKSLLVSHLAMLPFVIGIVWQSVQLVQKLFISRWQYYAVAILLADAGGTYDTKKDKLTRELEDLRIKYTDNHPDVIAVKKKLDKLEKNKDTYDNDIKSDPRYKELKNQLMTTSLEIKRLQNENASISAQVNKYLGRIEQTPAREQDMAALLREYDSTKAEYETLLKKSQGAQQAENLEKRQKGEQFKVIDPAKIPEKPFTPDVPKILLIGLFAGLAGGFAMAFIREQLDRSFHDAADVELSLGIKVLATIPKIEEKVS